MELTFCDCISRIKENLKRKMFHLKRAVGIDAMDLHNTKTSKSL